MTLLCRDVDSRRLIKGLPMGIDAVLRLSGVNGRQFDFRER